MMLLEDILPGLWIIAVTVVAFAMLPALALGRPLGRTRWWPEMLAGAAWSTLSVIVLVPLLAKLRLVNWATAVLMPLAWPLSLWLFRHRGAPSGAFRALSRQVTLTVLTWHWRRSGVNVGWRHVRVGAAAAGTAVVYCLAARELRFTSPTDYDTLAHTRAILAGGHWVIDPAASLAAIISRLASVDPMQALRFLRPLTWPGSVVASGIQAPTLNAAYAWTAVLAGVVLAALAMNAAHRRDPWHVVAACAVAAFAFAAPGAPAGEGGGYVEYDAAARQALRIVETFKPAEWIIAAPPEQRVEVPEPHRFMSLADFVRRFGERAGHRQFRFDVAGRDLFVFVEKKPLRVEPEAALASVRYATAADPYWRPNERAHLERRALALCEAYRRSHAGVSVYYDDANIRVYHIRH